MIFTVFMKDGSRHSYDNEKYTWYFGDDYFRVKNDEKGFAALFCPIEEIVKVVVEGHEIDEI